MPVQVKDSGTWKAAAVQVKSGGSWVTPTLYVKSAGVWVPVAYAANDGVDFSTGHVENAAMTGISDGKKGVFSCWFNITGSSGTLIPIFVIFASGSARLYVIRSSWNKIAVYGASTVPSTNLYLETTSSYTTSGWHHLLASWDLSTGFGKIYIDRVDKTSASPTLTNSNIDYTGTTNHVGRYLTSIGYISIQELYFNSAESLDITSSAVRAKFVDSSNKPVSLGATGNLPTGTAPIVYLKAAYDSFETNSGTGGDYTVSGTLADAGSSPSD